MYLDFCNVFMSGFPFQWILFWWWGLTFSVLSVRLIMSFLILLFTLCFSLIYCLNTIPSRSLTVLTTQLLFSYSIVILVYQTFFIPFSPWSFCLSVLWLQCRPLALYYNIALFLHHSSKITIMIPINQIANFT